MFPGYSMSYNLKKRNKITKQAVGFQLSSDVSLVVEPVSTHLISGPSISTKNAKPGYKWSSNFLVQVF